MARQKLNKTQRREERLRKARQWIVTYTGSPKKIVKHYRERFHLDTTCALKDLQAIGVQFTQEYLDAVKRSEEARLAERRRKREQKMYEQMLAEYEFADDRFAFIAGRTSGGAPYGLTWEEVGIDPYLPFEVKVRLYLSQAGGECLFDEDEWDELDF